MNIMQLNLDDLIDFVLASDDFSYQFVKNNKNEKGEDLYYCFVHVGDKSYPLSKAYTEDDLREHAERVCA